MANPIEDGVLYEVHQFSHPDFEGEVLTASHHGVRLNLPQGSIVIAVVNGSVCAFPIGLPDSINFGPYIDDVIQHAGGSSTAQLVQFDPDTSTYS